jgi:NADH:ubiquinone oxidoreductase subunit 4 (subunit M)
VAAGGLGRLLALLVIMTVVGESAATPGRWGGWRSAAAAYGGLALLGLPLTLAFAGRWATVIALTGYSPLVAALVLVAVGLAATAAVRFVMGRESADGTAPVAAAATLTAALLLITALLMGLLSPLLLQFFARLATGA